MKLNQIRDNKGAHKRRMRIGRGIGSGKGKTGGRGGKGQTARTGVAINGFEGGQMPLHRRMPKRGFNKPNRSEYVVINLSTLETGIKDGVIDAKQMVTAATLVEAGILRRSRDGVRLLGKGTLTQKVQLEIAGASAAAIAAVEKAGGSVKIIEVKAYNAKEQAAAKKAAG
jgi:large subunit ribosomal protein L15